MLLTSIPLGLAGLYCSAMIYIATKRQLWRQQRTLPRFFGTVAVVGFAVAATIFTYAGFSFLAMVLILAAVCGLGLKLQSEWAIYQDETADNYDVRSRRLIETHLQGSAKTRIFLALGAVGCLLLGAIASFASPMIGCAICGLGCMLLLAGENMERLLYFQSVVYDRMPGTL